MADVVTTSLLIQSAPPALACVLGILFAVARWRLHPAVSLLAIFGLGLRLAAMAGGIAWQRWVLASVAAGVNPSTLGFYSGIVNLSLQVVGAASLVLLVVAAFHGRSRKIAAAPLASGAA